MKFLIYSLNYEPELTGIGKYNSELAEKLVEMGNQVNAVVGYPYYPQWKLADGYNNKVYSKEKINGAEVIRCPMFIPRKVTALKRVMHLISFSVSSAFALFGVKKQDVIFVIQPTLFCAPAALLYGKLTGSLVVLHIQDFEIDAMFGLKISSSTNTLIKRMAYSTERWLLKKFDFVTTISKSMLKKAESKGVNPDNLYLLPNWSSVTHYDDRKFKSLREDWCFSHNDIIVMYSGNIGQKQGLEIIISTAKHFSSSNFIKFLIVGSGASVQSLKAYVKKEKLTNCFFYPLQPKELLQELLQTADIHLVIQKKGAADIVLPSKLCNILAVGGHAIVTAEKGTELHNISDEHVGIYHTIEPENAQALIDAINYMVNNSTKDVNRVAIKYAKSFLDKNFIIENFVHTIDGKLKNRKTCQDTSI